MSVLPPTTVPDAAALRACALLFPLLDKLVAKGILDGDDIANILGTAQTAIGPHLAKPGGAEVGNLMAYISRSLARG